MNKSIYIGLFAGMMLTACASDVEMPGQDVPGVQPENAIVVSGARAGVTASRADADAPGRQGICTANTIDIWAYKCVCYETSSDYKTWSNYELNSGLCHTITDLIPVENGMTLNMYEKWDGVSVKIDGYRWVGHTFVALAYNTSDKSGTNPKFREYMVKGDDGKDRPQNHFLELICSDVAGDNAKKASVPDLYLGQLSYTQTKFDSSKEYDSSHSYTGNGIQAKKNTGSANDYNNGNVIGQLYRMVSEINFNMDRIPMNNLKSVKLYGTDIATKVTLLGWGNNTKHGKYYPLTPASVPVGQDGAPSADHAKMLLGSLTYAAPTGDAQTGTVTVENGEINITDDGVLTFHTYLLPSTVGTQLILELTYQDDTATTKETMEIAPAMSYKLKDYATDVYNDHSNPMDATKNVFGDDVTGYGNKEGGDKLIFNAKSRRFFPYANMRLNLTGSYGNTSEATVTVEIESSYEKGHNITL